MCTAAAIKTSSLFFGRTLDYHKSFGEEVVFTPRRFTFPMRFCGDWRRHYAMVGAAIVAEGYPLYYDGMNERGVCVAGLNFPHSAAFFPPSQSKINLAQFEIIPYILGSCATAAQAAHELENVNLTRENFSKELPAAGLHWLIADGADCFVAESVAGGMRIHRNELGVLTNEPPFLYQLSNLSRYMMLSPGLPANNFCKGADIRPQGMGYGAIGLPGDMSPQSRFVRAAFFACNSKCGGGEEEGVNRLFHILGGVSVPYGCCAAEGGGWESTLYTCCCSPASGRYYFTTYSSLAPRCVDMRLENYEGDALVRYPMRGGFFAQVVNGHTC